MISATTKTLTPIDHQLTKTIINQQNSLYTLHKQSETIAVTPIPHPTLPPLKEAPRISKKSLVGITTLKSNQVIIETPTHNIPSHRANNISTDQINKLIPNKFSQNNRTPKEETKKEFLVGNLFHENKKKMIPATCAHSNTPTNNQNSLKFETKLRGFASKSKTGKAPSKPYKQNQDSYFIMRDFAGAKNAFLFGVMDGHGTNGHHVSEFVRKKFATNLELAEIRAFHNMSSYKIKALVCIFCTQNKKSYARGKGKIIVIREFKDKV